MTQDRYFIALDDRAMAPAWGLVGLCCLAELILILGDYNFIGPVRMRSWIYENWAFWPGLWRDWHPNYIAQPYTMFVTYAFLHGSLLHLGLNMVTLVSLGRGVIISVGPVRFLVIYAASAVGGALAYAILATSGAPMVGASGALFGLCGALAAWMWDASPTWRDSMSVVGRVVAMLIAINVVMYWGLHGRVAWETHLGGFIAGWIAALYIREEEAA